MLRRLVLVFTLLFVLSATASAFGQATSLRHANTGHRHTLVMLAATHLATETVAADADIPDGQLLGSEASDWPDSIDIMASPVRLPRLIHPLGYYAVIPLPFPTLAPPQRPPCVRA